MSTKNIVILGGSYAGLSTAHYLLKHAIPALPEKESYKVVVVSPSSSVFCRPACPRALISDELLPQDKLFVDIAKQYEQYPAGSFRFVHGTAIALDHKNRNVTVNLADGASPQKLEFHVLIVSTGASTPSPLLGLNRDDKFLRESWVTFREALSTAKTIIVGGGGPAGVETAGELGEYLNGRPGWFGSKPPTVRITVVTSASKILPNLRPVIAKRAEAYLEKVGVTVIKNSRVKSVSPEGTGIENVASKATVTFDNGETLETDLYIPAYGTTPNTSFVDKELLTSDGRIETNPSTLRVDKAGPRVYAAGDVSSAARPAIHLIFEAIPVLCANIKRDLLLAAGKAENEVGEDRMYKEDVRETQLVPLGRNVGVGAAMGWQVPSFMVWLIKGRDYWLWTTGSLWSGKQWAKAA